MGECSWGPGRAAGSERHPSPSCLAPRPGACPAQPWATSSRGEGRPWAWAAEIAAAASSRAPGCERAIMAAAGRTRMMTPRYAAHSRLRRGEANLGELNVRSAPSGAPELAESLAPRPACSGLRPRSRTQASLGTTGTSAARPGVRESPTTRSGSMSWDGLLPTLRLALVVYTQSEFEEAIRNTVP